MKLIWNRILRRYNIRHENRLLTEALRRSSKPVAPEGLRDRLIDQTPAGPYPIFSKPQRWAWAVGATAVLVIAAVCLTWWSGFHKNGSTPSPIHRPNVLVKRHEKVEPESPRDVPRIVKVELTDTRVPVVSRKTGSPAPVGVKQNTPAHVKIPDAPVRTPDPGAVAQNDSDDSSMYEASAIQVTVSRTPQDICYAKASASDTDVDGRSVRTEWTIAGDSNTRVSRQTLAVSDTSGQHQTLTVASSNYPEQQNGDEL